ncbi:hypothetical protein GCM10027586_00840 [Kineococcus gypseus]|uniref:major capsid protein n=1 Tax=Kineococcus gypseus TaxID=1637102 RepID=UPI003D7E1AE7
MPVTLAQAQQNAQTDLDVSVIDEFRVNQIMDLLTYDDAVNPAGGGATLTYGYRRLVTPSAAAFRAINTEYAPSEVTTQQYNVDLKVLGGTFQIDRVLARVGPAASGAVALNLSQKIKAVQALFGDTVINGDSATVANSFDGLSKALAGSSTENTIAIDLTGTQDQTWAFRVLSVVDDLLGQLDGPATALIANKRLINIIRAAARLTSMYVREPGPRDTYVESYGSARLIDAGSKAGLAAEVIPVNAADPDGAGPLVAGSTALYAVRFGLDGFHGVTTVGSPLVFQALPDFTTPGAVKTGEVEMGPVATALKATKAAAVARNIKVQ